MANHKREQHEQERRSFVWDKTATRWKSRAEHEQHEQERERWLIASTDLIPSECISDILTEALRLQSLKQAQSEQTQENCTLQELEKIAEEVNLPIELLHDATKTVLMHREQQELVRQQKERDRQERRERAIATLNQHTKKALPGVLAGGGLVLAVMAIKNTMLPFLAFYTAPPAASPLPMPIPTVSASPKVEPTPIPRVSASSTPKSNLNPLAGAKIDLDSHFGKPGEPEYLSGNPSSEITGTLKSIKFCKRATLYFDVYDSDENRVGLDSSSIDNLKAGELWAFKVKSYERGAYRFEAHSFSCDEVN